MRSLPDRMIASMRGGLPVVALSLALAAVLAGCPKSPSPTHSPTSTMTHSPTGTATHSPTSTTTHSPTSTMTHSPTSTATHR